MKLKLFCSEKIDYPAQAIELTSSPPFPFKTSFSAWELMFLRTYINNLSLFYSSTTSPFLKCSTHCLGSSPWAWPVTTNVPKVDPSSNPLFVSSPYQLGAKLSTQPAPRNTQHLMQISKRTTDTEHDTSSVAPFLVDLLTPGIFQMTELLSIPSQA